MKVLHIINSLNIGGAEKLLSFLLPSIVNKSDIIIELLILQRGDENLYNSVKKTGIKVHCLQVKTLRDPRCIFKISPFFLKSYDIIHAHLFPSLYWSICAKRLSGQKKTKLVYTEHSTSNGRIRSPWLSMFDRRMYKYLDHLVCITEEIENIYLKYQPKLLGKTTVIPNGIPINEIVKTSPLNRNSISNTLSYNDRLLLQVSSFRYPKDQDTIIKTLEKLPPHYKVLFVGSGGRIKECQELSQKLNVHDRVFFLGNRADVYSLLKTVDYVILSTHYEGLSLACIEGMASGKPFLASDVKGVHQLVEGAGILFQDGNSEQLAKEIIFLEKNVNYKQFIIERGRARAEQYSVERMTENYIRLYKSLV